MLYHEHDELEVITLDASYPATDMMWLAGIIFIITGLYMVIIVIILSYCYGKKKTSILIMVCKSIAYIKGL